MTFVERARSSDSICIWRDRSATSAATAWPVVTSSTSRFCCSAIVASSYLTLDTCSAVALTSVRSWLTSAMSGTSARSSVRTSSSLRWASIICAASPSHAILRASISLRRANCCSSFRSTSALTAFRPFSRVSIFSTNSTRALTREMRASSSATASFRRVAFRAASSTPPILPRKASILASSSGARADIAVTRSSNASNARRSAPSLSRSRATSACDVWNS